MKLMKSILGLAAVAAVIPYKTEAVDNEQKKTCNLTSLTWKAEYNSDKETGDTTLSVDLLGGLQEAIDKTVDFVRDVFFTDEADCDFYEVVEIDGEEDVADESASVEGEAVEAIAEAVEITPTKIVEEIPAELVAEVVEAPVEVAPVAEEKAIVKDEKFDEAVQVAIEEGKISTSMLQRKLSIGYSRATKIIAAMEEAGVVGPSDGKSPRQVLVGRE